MILEVLTVIAIVTKKTSDGKVVRSAGQPNACKKAVFKTSFAPAFWIAFPTALPRAFPARLAECSLQKESRKYWILQATGVALFTEILHITNSSHPACYRTCDWHEKLRGLFHFV